MTSKEVAERHSEIGLIIDSAEALKVKIKKVGSDYASQGINQVLIGLRGIHTDLAHRYGEIVLGKK